MKRAIAQDSSGSAIAKHCAGLAALLLLFVGLLTQLGLDWHSASSGSSETSAQQAASLASLRQLALPLRGASERLAQTKAAIEDFYVRRIPTSYSQVSSRIVDIGIASGVQLSHVTYDQRARGNYLTEVSIESQVNGTYPQIMRFVNGLEGDQDCFVIRAMTLTGQQGGEVSLQLKFSTWLRPAGQPLQASASAKSAQATSNSAKEND